MFQPEQYLQRQAEKKENNQNFNNEEYLNELLTMAAKANQIDRIKMKDFIDLYGHEAVRQDWQWVKEQKENQQTKNSPSEIWHKKVADILEAILHEQIEVNDWFSENAYTIKTCPFDDRRGGVDTIVEVRNPEQRSANYTGIALDVTSASNPSCLDKKIKRILNKIKKGELAKIKYFKSDFLNFRGEKSNIPLFVIGCDLKHTEQLAKLWYNDQQHKLAEHPIQVLILNQIIQQAQLYQDYAIRCNQPEIAAIYEQTLVEFRAIAEEKKAMIEKIKKDPHNFEFFQDDTVFNNLKMTIKNYV